MSTRCRPHCLDQIMRITAHLYEHREILIPGREFVAPDYCNGCNLVGAARMKTVYGGFTITAAITIWFQRGNR